MLLKEIGNNLKRFGIWNTIYDLIYLAVNKIFLFKNLQIITLDLNSLNQACLELPSNYKDGFLSKKELLIYSQDDTFEMSLRFINEALDKEDICYGITVEGELIHYCWNSQRCTNFNDELSICFNEDWIYSYKSYTKLAHRGKKLFPIGLAKQLIEFSKKGKKGFVACIERNNFKSIHSCKRVGYQFLGNIIILKILNKYWIRASKECAPYGFNIKPNSIRKE